MCMLTVIYEIRFFEKHFFNMLVSTVITTIINKCYSGYIIYILFDKPLLLSISDLALFSEDQCLISCYKDNINLKRLNRKVIDCVFQ